MSTDMRRPGDRRPYKRVDNISWRFYHGRPFRWLPRQGEPWCVAEWLAQAIIKTLAFVPVYIAIIVTLTLLIQIFGVPFVDGGK